MGTIGSPGEYDQSVRLSPDGSMVLASRREPTVGTSDIWRLDLTRNTEERVTAGRGGEVTPVLAADGRTLIFAADQRGSVPSLFRRDLVTGVEEPLLPSGLQQRAMDVIPGEQALLYVQRSKQGTFDIFRLPLAAGASPAPVLESRLDKSEARVSPNGRAIAFTASDGQRTGLYVAPLPITAAPIVVVADIWGPPRWSHDGRRLYYVGDNDRMMAIAVGTGPALTIGTPQQVFQFPRRLILLDVARDGRFLLLRRQVIGSQQPISVAIAAIRGGQQ